MPISLVFCSAVKAAKPTKPRQAMRTASPAKAPVIVPLRQKAYQRFGDLYLDFPEHEKYSHYERALDLRQALCGIRYQVKGTTLYNRK
jgi:hypothetical protein